jgi:lysophospholipid acyltransferase (LPLAT)-like uncharacterized protein
MLKTISRFPLVQSAIGQILALYLRFVRLTTRFSYEPADFTDRLKGETPFIAAIWHGQNFMITLAMWQGAQVSVLITRHGDGGVVAKACEAIGIKPIRASGGDARKLERKGGAAGLRAMLTALQGGDIVVMTPDVPKVARVAGRGIIALARLSGRPILPIVVATSRRIDLNNWDRTSVCLPFGRGVMMVGEPIYVARDASEETEEAARLRLQASLDAVHDRAYAALGTTDPAALLKAANR